MRKVVVTSGPTREHFDPVRFLSNPSTGRMGSAIAAAALLRGAQVSYICGPVNPEFTRVDGAKNISVTSTLDMLAAVEQEMEEGAVLIMAAAPADYRPKVRSEVKLKKTSAPQLELVPNPDILKTIAEKKEAEKYILYGFAAETNNGEEYARKKLREKNLDGIFLNDVSRTGSGFGSMTNRIELFRADGSNEIWDTEEKTSLGEKIISEIFSHLP